MIVLPALTGALDLRDVSANWSSTRGTAGHELGVGALTKKPPLKAHEAAEQPTEAESEGRHQAIARNEHDIAPSAAKEDNPGDKSQ